MAYLTASSVDCFSEFFHKTEKVQHGATFIIFGPWPDLYFGSAVTSHVACSNSPLPCPLLQHLWRGTSACAACSWPCQTRHFEMWICANPGTLLWNNSYKQRFTHYNAMTHMQRKEKGPRLSTVVYTQCDCHLGFNFALSLIVGYFDCLFLTGLLNCMQSALLFVLLHVFCTSRRMNLFLVYNSHSEHQADYTIQQVFTLRGTPDCSMVIVMTLLHTSSII